MDMKRKNEQMNASYVRSKHARGCRAKAPCCYYSAPRHHSRRPLNECKSLPPVLPIWVQSSGLMFWYYSKSSRFMNDGLSVLTLAD